MTAAADPTGALIEYGAIGIIAILAILAVRILFAREVAAHDAERARADRLENELRELNVYQRTEVMRTLGSATEAIHDALELVRDMQQHNDRGR